MHILIFPLKSTISPDTPNGVLLALIVNMIIIELFLEQLFAPLADHLFFFTVEDMLLMVFSLKQFLSVLTGQEDIYALLNVLLAFSVWQLDLAFVESRSLRHLKFSA